MSGPRPLIVLAAVCLAAACLVIGGCAGSDEMGAAAPAPAELRVAPWADQPDGSPSVDQVGRWPSALFGPSVSYPEALEAVLLAAARGEPIRGAALADPLPAEVVYVAPEAPAVGIRLSLTAPFGWDLERRVIRPASVSLPGELSPEEVAARVARALVQGNPLPEGARVDVPALDACQIAHGAPDNRPVCP